MSIYEGDYQDKDHPNFFNVYTCTHTYNADTVFFFLLEQGLAELDWFLLSTNEVLCYLVFLHHNSFCFSVLPLSVSLLWPAVSS